MPLADNPGYRSGMVDLQRGRISREIFVNDAIYQQELERSSRAPGSLSATRARSRTPAILWSPAWARSRSSCAATAAARCMYS